MNIGNMSEWAKVKKEFRAKGLLEELYFSPRGKYVICLYAGWQLIALCTDVDKTREFGQEFGIFISEKDATTLIEHSADGSDQGIYAGLVTQTEAVFLYSETMLEKAIQIQGEIARGERKVMISEEFLRKLKKNYIQFRQKDLQKFGDPSCFSDVKLSHIWLSYFILPFGGPFWVLGRPLPAILYIICFVVNVIFPPFAILYVLLVIVSFVLVLVLVGTGKIRDKKGKRIVSIYYKEDFTYWYRLVNKYQKEIEE